MIHRSQPRRLNKDTDERLLKFDEMKEAMNVLVKASVDGDEGAIKMAEGNSPISFVSGESLPSGTNTVIGSVTDEDALVIYFFVHNSLGDHTVCGYSSSLDKCFIVYQNSALSFQQNGFVKADIVKNRRVSSAGALVIDQSYETPDTELDFGGGDDDPGEGISVFAKQVNYEFTFDMSVELTKRGNAIGRDFYGDTGQAVQTLVDIDAFVGSVRFFTNAGGQNMYDGAQDVTDDATAFSLNRVVENYAYEVVNGKPCLVASGTVFVNPNKLDDGGARLTVQISFNPVFFDLAGEKTLLGNQATALEIESASVLFNEPGANINTDPVEVISTVQFGGPFEAGYVDTPKISDIFSPNPSDYVDSSAASNLQFSIKTISVDAATGLSTLQNFAFPTTPIEDAFFVGRLSIDFEGSEWYELADGTVNQSFDSLFNNFSGLDFGLDLSGF
tara:strand:+ start:3204 stop:4538 length:1335 start_codon:yes stop_codon:yes gene_type:complete